MVPILPGPLLCLCTGGHQASRFANRAVSWDAGQTGRVGLCRCTSACTHTHTHSSEENRFYWKRQVQSHTELFTCVILILNFQKENYSVESCSLLYSKTTVHFPLRQGSAVNSLSATQSHGLHHNTPVKMDWLYDLGGPVTLQRLKKSCCLVTSEPPLLGSPVRYSGVCGDAGVNNLLHCQLCKITASNVFTTADGAGRVLNYLGIALQIT